MYIIGICGGSGSGKTTFAKKLQKQCDFELPILHMDSYYLPEQPKEFFTCKGKPNYDHPAAFDWELLRTHLSQLKEGKDIEAPVYDFKTSSRLSETVKIKATDIILFEGIFTLFDQEIRNLLDIRSFLHVDSDIRFARRMNRDVKERGRSVESVIEQYYETVRPMYQKYLDPQRQHADFVVGEETDIAASILSAKVRELCFDRTRDHKLERSHLNYENSELNVKDA